MFESQQGQELLLFCKTTRLRLDPTQSPIQSAPDSFFDTKWQGREADHSSVSIAEFKNEWSYISTSVVYLHGVDRDFRELCEGFIFFTLCLDYISLLFILDRDYKSF